MNKESENRLQNLLSKIRDIPSYRRKDYRWLLTNIEQNYKDHVSYEAIMRMLVEILQEQNLIKSKESKRILAQFEERSNDNEIEVK